MSLGHRLVCGHIEIRFQQCVLDSAADHRLHHFVLVKMHMKGREDCQVRIGRGNGFDVPVFSTPVSLRARACCRSNLT